MRRASKLFYESSAWSETWWLGTQTIKNPLDLWIYQEIMAETKPELIVETGTYAGGSALYLASICDLLDCGEVVSVDIRPVSDFRAKAAEYIEWNALLECSRLSATQRLACRSAAGPRYRSLFHQ